MALIKCPECGKEISDKASVCPNCGCPLKEKEVDSKFKANNKVKVFLGLIAMAIITIVLVLNSKADYKLPRNAKWGESLNTVLKREQKIIKAEDLKIHDDYFGICNLNIYNDSPDTFWYNFDENNELYLIRIVYDSYDYYEESEKVDEQFLNILKSVKEELGEPNSEDVGSIVQNAKWSFSDTFVTLEYESTNGWISLEFRRQP